MIENDVIKHLCAWLEKDGWLIESVALGRAHGVDIRASKNGRTLLIEAKGAKGNPENHSVVRAEFDSGQIKDHLGVAIVKVLELKNAQPNAQVVIAHPNTERIKRIVTAVVPHLTEIGVAFAFVSDNGEVEWVGSKAA